jgi:hypothetical protein
MTMKGRLAVDSVAHLERRMCDDKWCLLLVSLKRLTTSVFDELACSFRCLNSVRERNFDTCSDARVL